MIYFLRTKNNKTIVDLEFYTDEYPDGTDMHEMSVSIDIKEYSKYLLSQPVERHDHIIGLFHQLSEHRGWLWENYYMAKKNTGNAEDGKQINDHLVKLFTTVAEVLGLTYVRD